MAKIEPPNPTAAALTAIAAGDMSPENIKAAMTYPAPPADAELVGRVPRVNKTNGPSALREKVERGLLEFDVLTADNERLKRELNEALLKVKQLEVQISEIEGTRNTIESRINACVLERDQAVREAGELRGALNSVAAICVRYHNAQQQD